MSQKREAGMWGTATHKPHGFHFKGSIEDVQIMTNT